MNKQDFRKFANGRTVILDGATGTSLFKAGMPGGCCSEQWITGHPDIVRDLQSRYVESGSEILIAATFGANRTHLATFGLENEIIRLNTEPVRIAKEAAAGKALVSGDISMTGEMLEPYGEMEYEELVGIYEEQIGILVRAGVDLLTLETFISADELKAALEAARNVCPDMAVLATMSFNENGKTMFGDSPEEAIRVMEAGGADAVGLNCSVGPDKLAPIVREFSEFTKLPVIAKPNAGMPHPGPNGENIYDMTPQAFAENMKALLSTGASLVGGCCGTTPDYIAALKKIL